MLQEAAKEIALRAELQPFPEAGRRAAVAERESTRFQAIHSLGIKSHR